MPSPSTTSTSQASVFVGVIDCPEVPLQVEVKLLKPHVEVNSTCASGQGAKVGSQVPLHATNAISAIIVANAATRMNRIARSLVLEQRRLVEEATDRMQ